MKKSFLRLSSLIIITLILAGCSRNPEIPTTDPSVSEPSLPTISEPSQVDTPPATVAALVPTTTEPEPSEPRTTLAPITFAPVNISPIDPPNEEYFVFEDSSGDFSLLTLADIYYRYYLSASIGGILIDSWETANDIHPSHFIGFFVDHTRWTQTTWEDIYIPAEFFEPYIMRYFDVESEQLRKARNYNAEDNTYWLTQYYPAGNGSRITGVSIDGIVMTIDYELYGWEDDDTPYIAGVGKLKVENIHGFAYFRYISNEVKYY